MSVIKTDLVTDFGSYYLPEGQNEARLLSGLRQKSVTTTHAKPIIHDGDVYRFANVTLGGIVQGFQKAFTASGNIEFKPNEIRLRNLKIDLSLFPDDVKGSWLGFLSSLTDDERKNWPIVRYLLEKEVLPQIPHDLETAAYFKGAYSAPTPGTATTVAQVMDGLKSIITTAQAGDANTIVLTDAITEENAFDRVEEFVDGLSELTDKGVKTKMYMDPKILRWYNRDKRNTHGTDVNYDPSKPVVDFTNVELVGLPSMSGEKMIWATPVDNFLYIRKANGMKSPRVEESKREVFLMTDWWEGLGFGYDALVYAATWV
jgi:hypothetical protein